MKQRLYYVLPAIILGALIVWRLSANKQAKAAQLQAANARKKAPVNVQVATAQIRDIVHTFQGVANIEAPAEIRIAPKVTGRLDYLSVREGDRVAKGQVLARIDPTQAQAAVSQQQAAVESARANLNNASVRYSRYYSLYKQGFVAAQEVDDNKAQLEVQRSALRAAQAQLRSAQSQLSDLILKSPINGFVTARFVDPGSVVTGGQALVTVQAMRDVYVTTYIPETVRHSVRPGTPAEVELDAYPGRTFTGTVAQVNAAADPVSRQFLVRARLGNQQNLIRPGMFSRMTLVLAATRNAVVVPHEAVQTARGGSGEKTVTVVDEQMVAHKRPVQIGDRDALGVAITSGVRAGETVVVLSPQPVKDGQVVKIDKGAGRGRQARGAGGEPTVIGGGAGGPVSGGAPSGTGGAGGGGGASTLGSSNGSAAIGASGPLGPNGGRSSSLGSGGGTSAGGSAPGGQAGSSGGQISPGASGLGSGFGNGGTFGGQPTSGGTIVSPGGAGGGPGTGGGLGNPSGPAGGGR